MIGRRGLLAGAGLLTGAAAKAPPAATPISRLAPPWWRRRHEAKLAEIRGRHDDLLWLGDSITQIEGVAPQAAVMLIGANNLGRLHWPAEDDVAGIAAVVGETRRRLPRTRVLLLGVLPSERSAWASETTLAINRALATRYRGGEEVVFMDLAAVFAPGGRLDLTLFLDPLLSPPEPPLHPTAAGQARLAAAIEPTLARLLGEPPKPPLDATGTARPPRTATHR